MNDNVLAIRLVATLLATVIGLGLIWALFSEFKQQYVNKSHVVVGLVFFGIVCLMIVGIWTVS